MKIVEEYKPLVIENGIKLNGNECFYDIGQDVLGEFFSKLKNIEFNRYPDSNSNLLKEKYAAYVGVNKENIIVGNGSDEAIGLIISAYIQKGKKVLTLNPDFSMYDFYVSSNEGELIKLACNEDGSYSVDDFIALGKKEKVDLIIFSNPNNPTGFAVEENKIKKILESFKDIIVVVDEAYIEFYGKSVIKEINNYENLLVTRTLSKAFGGASLRVGFLVGNERLIEKLNKFKVPYNVNTLSQTFGEVLIDKKEKMKFLRDLVIEERERVFIELKNIEKKINGKIKFYPSNANFIFGRGDKLFIEVFKEKDIAIRNFNNDTFRITIGSREENDYMLKVLKECMMS